MAWYDNAVFYHIYPLGMTGAEEHPDGVLHHRFPELKAYLPYLKVLGCDAIYLGPVFSSESHGYDTTDYRTVDPRLGTNEELRDFVDCAHNYGIHIVLDAVFNHSGRSFFAFRDLLQRGGESAYRSWYKHVDFSSRSVWNDPFSYSAWHGFLELPEYNFNEEALRRYLIDTVRYWVSAFDIDGLRLDCADVLDLSFQHSLRYFTNEMKPEFWLMGEVIHGEYARWVNPETLHSVTNYELHKSLYSAFNSHNFFEAAHNLQRNLTIARDLYTFLENHDVDRIASKLEEIDQLYPIYLALFTLPGHPSIYYGGEFALKGKKEEGGDSVLRPSISIDEMKPNRFTSYIAKLAEIHGRNSELSLGEYRELLLTNRQWVYARCDHDSCVVTALNNDVSERTVTVTLPQNSGFAMDLFSEEELMVQGSNQLTIAIPGNGGRLIKVK